MPDNPASRFNEEARNPLYNDWVNTWRKLSDCYDGEEAVKARGETYLPAPSGFAKAADSVKMYAAYQLRAQVPELLAPTVRGLTGLLHRKPSQYEFGPVKHLIENATADGMPLDAFHRRVSRDIFKHGRMGILVDAPESGGETYFAAYTAESIIDWETDRAGNLTYVALDESRQERDEQGRWREVKRWRVLELVDGVYNVTVYEIPHGRKRVRMAEEAGEATPQAANGKKLNFIPFVFVNTTDLAVDPDDAPLAGVANAMLSIYRLDADYRHTLYLTSQPTPVAIGVDPENAPTVIGSASIWVIPQGGDAKMLEFTGAGALALRQAIEDDYEKAIAAGAQLFNAGQQGQVESGEALRIRYAGQTATLPSIAQNIAAGLQMAAQFAARLKGGDGESITVTPNLDFVEMRLTPEEISSLIDSWLKGAISKITLFDNLRRGQIIAEDKEFEDEEEEIAETTPDLLPPPEEEPPDDETDEDVEDEGAE